MLAGGNVPEQIATLMVAAAEFGGQALCLATEATPDVPFEVAVQVKFTPVDGAAGLVFHADGADRHYGFYPTNGSVRLSRFDGPDVYSWAVLREVRPPQLKRDGWNSLKVRVEAERMQCYLNGELVIEANDVTYKTGARGAFCKFRQTDAEIQRSFVLASRSPIRVRKPMNYAEKSRRQSTV